MSEKKRDIKPKWNDDEIVEWSDEVFERAEIAVGGKIIRPAMGTLTKRGRPPVGDEPKQQVTLRLAPKVIRYFKNTGSGWQTRMNAVLERHVSGTLREHSRSMPRSIAGVYAMANEQTGKRAGKAASKVMRSGNTGRNSKTAAASALTQRPNKKKK